MLSLREFNLLAKGQKLTFLWEQCNYIMVRVEGNYRINLYGCMDFYAEVWYKYGQKKVHKIACFRSIRYLSPYLHMIDIKDCLQEY